MGMEVLVLLSLEVGFVKTFAIGLNVDSTYNSIRYYFNLVYCIFKLSS